MRDSDLDKLSDGEFKRWCGVSRSTFTQMLEILSPRLERGGR